MEREAARVAGARAALKVESVVDEGERVERAEAAMEAAKAAGVAGAGAGAQAG